MATCQPKTSELAEVEAHKLAAVTGGFVKAYYEPGFAIRDSKGVGVTLTEDGIYWKTSTGEVGHLPFPQ